MSICRSRKRHVHRRALPALLAGIVAATVACTDELTGPDASESDGLDFTAFLNAVRAGRPLPSLNRSQRREFELGSVVFQTIFTPETGLGPLFNSNSCATCHSGPVTGGFGIQIETHATAFDGET
ncbi:MAG: hypothetical protein OEZ42_10355 [Gemmatimonadota bacterium]|nr:hypothetical protein [Gemmatimonadota bacterium]